MAEKNEVGDDLGGGASVVDLDGRVFGNSRAAIHQHEREPLPAHRGERCIGHAARRDEQTVRLPLAQDAERRLLTLGLVVRVAEHELVAAVARRLLRPTDDRREERVGDVRDEHSEGPRPAQSQPRLRYIRCRKSGRLRPRRFRRQYRAQVL